MTVRTGEGAANPPVAMSWTGEGAQAALDQALCKAAGVISHPERRAAALQEEPVGAVPVAVDDVCPPVAVEVGQRDSSAVLVLVGHTSTQSHYCETLLRCLFWGKSPARS